MYIGITGITTPEQAKEILDIWNKLNLTHFTEDEICPYHLMIGMLVSYKQLQGNEFTNPRYIPLSNLKPVCNILNQNNIYRIIHYNTHNPLFYYELEKIKYLNEQRLNFEGFQLNISNPPLSEVLKVNQRNFFIILQLNHSFLNNLQYVGEFRDVSQFLIDASGGRGRPLVKEEISRIINELIKMKIPLEKIGIAGGISEKTIASCVRDFPNISYDAESQLRTKDNELDLNKVKLYLEAFFEELTRMKKDKV